MSGKCRKCGRTYYEGFAENGVCIECIRKFIKDWEEGKDQSDLIARQQLEIDRLKAENKQQAERIKELRQSIQLIDIALSPPPDIKDAKIFIEQALEGKSDE